MAGRQVKFTEGVWEVWSYEGGGVGSRTDDDSWPDSPLPAGVYFRSDLSGETRLVDDLDELPTNQELWALSPRELHELFDRAKPLGKGR